MDAEEKKAYMRNYRAVNKEKLTAQNRIKVQERRLRNKQRAIEYLGGKCIDCGLKSEYRGVYDFHHVNPEEKDSDPGSLLHYSWARIVAELDKCVLLCANCHRIRHAVDE